MGEWRPTTWGELATLEYGKALRGYQDRDGCCRVYGTNGPIGWHTVPLYDKASVIVGRKGAYRGIHYAPDPFFVIDTAFYLKPKVPFDIRWAYYELLTHDINAMDSGSAIPSTSREAFYRLAVVLPPLVEQRAIASLLGALDDKIELNRRMNETLEAVARAIYKDWFVDFGPTRAKAENRVPYLSSETWDLFPDSLDHETGSPAGWPIESLYDQAEWVNGAAYKNMHFSDAADALPVVKIAELKAGVTANTKRTNTALGDKYRIDSGDLLFSWSGNPDTSIDAFIWSGGPAWLNQHIFAVRSNRKQSKAMLFIMLKNYMPEFAAIARNKQTTGLGHVTKADMQRMIMCPGSNEVRRAFDQIVGALFDQMVANLYESQTLAQVRDLLLPKLMSGRIRLHEAERAVEAVA